MIIMFIFLALTLILIIGTALYLNAKKQKITKGMKVQEVTYKKKSNRKSKRQLKDVLKIKIKDNTILFGTRYSIIIKLGNIDYNMLSDEEQASIENILIQTALAIDYPIQFFSTTEFIDTTKVIERINNNKNVNEKIKEYQSNLINYLQNLMENRNISIINNYAIISYDGEYEKAIDELNRRVLSFKNSLLRAKIQCEILEETELYNLIYRELNKNSNSKVDFIMKGSEKLYVEK